MLLPRNNAIKIKKAARHDLCELSEEKNLRERNKAF